MKKKSLLGGTSSPISLEVAIKPVDLDAHPHEVRHETHAHGPKPSAAAAPAHAADKPKKAPAAPNPANAFRGASRGS